MYFIHKALHHGKTQSGAFLGVAGGVHRLHGFFYIGDANAAVGDGDAHHAAQSIRREIDAQVDDRLPELLTLDFSGVTFMDSSGVGLILGRGRHISALGGRLTVQNPPPAVRRMLDLARITYA